jgi:ribonuclease P protein component
MDSRPPSSLALRRAHRIKQGRDFLRTRTEGRRLAQGCLILNWRALPASSTSRLGVITTRKLGNAVVRTRARRLLREAFRLRQHCLVHPADLVLVARSSIVGRKMGDVEKDFVTALRRAGLFREPERALSAER